MARESTPLFATVLARLSERERRLVLLLAGSFGAIIVVGVLFFGSRAIETRRKNVAKRRDEIAQLESLRDKYEEAVQTEKKSSGKIRSNTTSLFSVMQKHAGEVGLTLTDLNERHVPVKDAPDVQEVTVDVNLKEITIDKLDTLLEKVEGKRNDGVVKVSKMRVKTRFDKPDMLEANFTVSTWKSSAAATAKPADAKPGAPE